MKAANLASLVTYVFSMQVAGESLPIRPIPTAQNSRTPKRAHLGVYDATARTRFLSPLLSPLLDAMREYALSLGVPDDAIVLDYAGRRTYDSCYRARAIFGVTQAILVTQAFHLPRAIYLCNMLGVDGVGVKANNRPIGVHRCFSGMPVNLWPRLLRWWMCT